MKFRVTTREVYFQEYIVDDPSVTTEEQAVEFVTDGEGDAIDGASYMYPHDDYIESVEEIKD